MAALQLWLQDNLNEQRLEELRIKLEEYGINVTPAHVYFFVLATGVIYLATKWAFKKSGTRPWLKIHPRSPDPDDVTQFAEKRMKPTDRPPGSQ